MKKINESYKNCCLKTGGIGCSDNYVFTNCPNWFMEEVESLVASDANNTISCSLKFTRKEERGLLRTLGQCDKPFKEKVLCRTLILSMFMIELMRKKGLQEFERLNLERLEKGVYALFEGDYEKSIIFHACDSPNVLDLKDMVKLVGNLELNVFLYGLEGIEIQQALNNLIGAREPYAIKLFTAKERLNVYYDQVGNLIQNPHDFRLIDASKMIEDSNDCENEDD